jgi:MoaA/NifB/PqqE/SkfB family radical SAM enzyme
MIERMQEEMFHPRLIVWALAGKQPGQEFSTQECLLTIESIARLSKPIVVLTGANIIRRSDLYDIIEYGTVLGLKIIVEVRPDDITSDILQQYAIFGPKIFRVLVDGCVVEDPDTRYKSSKEFDVLRNAIRLLKANKYEIHLGIAEKHLNVRELAFYHDFAFRSVANGLYCHLFRDAASMDNPISEDADEILEMLARMKGLSPKTMYISPQCVKYGPRQLTTEPHEEYLSGFSSAKEWDHFCLGGRTYAFIDSNGKIYVCANSPIECNELRLQGYDFKKIWEGSEIFQVLRNRELTCSEAQLLLQENTEVQSSKVPL